MVKPEKNSLRASRLEREQSIRRGKKNRSVFAAEAASIATKPVKTPFNNEETKKGLPLFSYWPGITDWLEKRSKKDAEEEIQPQRVSWMALLRYSTFNERMYMIFGIICASISGLSLPAWLVLLAMSLDRFSNLARLIDAIGGQGLYDAVRTELNKLVVAFAIVGVISLFTGMAYVGIFTYTGESQALRIKQKYVTSAFHQDAAWFDSHKREELPTMVANSMVYISGAIGRQMADTYANLWSACGCLAVALVLNTPLALIMLCAVPIVAIIIGILSCFIRKASKESAEQFSLAGAIATETISGIKTVASLCAERWALDSYEGLVRGAQQKSVWSGFLAGLCSGVTRLLFYITYTVAFIIGTEQVANNSGWDNFINCFFRQEGEPDPSGQCSITGASIMCCIYGVILCATFFGLMQPGLQAINQGRRAAVDVFATIERTPTIDPSSEDGLKLKQIDGLLELQNVLFAYPSRPENIIFRNVNLVIEPGTSVALVGPSGSGKSTVSRLLLRFYDPTSGDVLVDGTPMRDLNVAWWRQQIGYVSQEPTLFPGTIKENILAGKLDATDEEVYEAAKAACAHEFILGFPDGYDTFYSGASIQLSGGQMQRIAIARAMIRRPSVLLLDEATSALDSNSERQVQNALANIRKRQTITTVTVAHRLSTIVSSDKIAVISKGEIAELGTHTELLKAGGIYADLCDAQGITLESEFGVSSDIKEVPESPLVDTSEAAKEGKADRDVENAIDEKSPDAAEEEASEIEMAPLSRLWGQNAKEWAYLVMGIIGAGMVGACSPSESILTAQIVANFYIQEPENMHNANLKWSLSFLALGGASFFGNIMSACGFSVAGSRLTRRLRTLTFESIVRRPMAWFDVPEHSTGELTYCLEGDAEAVAKVTGWALGYRIQVFVCLLTGVIISLVFAWQVGLVSIACVPLIIGAAVIQSCCLSKRFEAKREGLSPNTILEQGLRGINAVQAYGREDITSEKYSNALQPEYADKVREGKIAGFVFGFSQFAIFASFAIVFYVGSVLLTNQKTDFAGFFTAVLAVMFGAVGVSQVNADYNAQQDGLTAAARIYKIIDEPLDDRDPFRQDGEAPPSLDGAITFDSIWFHYPTRPNHQIFYPTKDRNGLELSISSKESIAFVGKSGCGKSTALQLVLRFYDCTGGAVLVDTSNVKALNTSWLRNKIGYVGQNPVLFAGTVRENILLGKANATDEEIIEAAKAANAHDFIMELDNGYDTQIGSEGGLLSGGQRQRIAIARAIIKNPPILVLDEATSALDTTSERIVDAALQELQTKQPRTTLMVAHRLVTVRHCDRIVVLDKGGVKEIGSHDSLIKQKGLYYDLWRKQA